MSVLHSREVAAILLLALSAFSACGGGAGKDALDGDLGPGAGGDAVGTQTRAALNKPDGTAIGSYGHDAAFFTLTVPSPTLQGVLTNTSNGITIVLSHISGRADTPCRFSAAILARDAGYRIGDTGFLTNSSGQKLYETNASSPGAYQRLFCAELRDNAGIQFSVLASAPDKLGWLQVHAVLNSVRKE